MFSSSHSCVAVQAMRNPTILWLAASPVGISATKKTRSRLLNALSYSECPQCAAEEEACSMPNTEVKSSAVAGRTATLDESNALGRISTRNLTACKLFWRFNQRLKMHEAHN